jgi:hypothetical protein
VLVNVTKASDALEFSLTNPVRRQSADWVSVRTILIEKNEMKKLFRVASRIRPTQNRRRLPKVLRHDR